MQLKANGNNAQFYNSMIAKREEEIAALEKKTAELREYDKVCKQRKEQLTSTSQILDEILTEGKISDVNLIMLVNKVSIHQNEDKTLDIKFDMNGNFSSVTLHPPHASTSTNDITIDSLGS